MQSNNTQPVKPKYFWKDDPSRCIAQMFPFPCNWKKGFLARLGSLEEMSGNFWKEWYMDRMLSRE